MESNRVVLSAKQKALRINMNHDLYGTFAEIGAGQEVVRHFFRAGGASGTIAKTISAYDKDFSDAIYGVEPSGRYVCEARVHKMIDHEYRFVKSGCLGKSTRPSASLRLRIPWPRSTTTRRLKGTAGLASAFKPAPTKSPTRSSCTPGSTSRRFAAARHHWNPGGQPDLRVPLSCTSSPTTCCRASTTSWTRTALKSTPFK